MKRPWSREDIRQARQSPLKPVLEAMGYRLLPRQDGNYAIAELPGDIVVKQHYWVRLEDGAAGNAIDFMVTIRGMSFAEAMRLLTS